MIVDEPIMDVDLKRLLDEEKRARLDNETAKSSILCNQIVSLFF